MAVARVRTTLGVQNAGIIRMRCGLRSGRLRWRTTVVERVFVHVVVSLCERVGIARAQVVAINRAFSDHQWTVTASGRTTAAILWANTARLLSTESTLGGLSISLRVWRWRRSTRVLGWCSRTMGSFRRAVTWSRSGAFTAMSMVAIRMVVHGTGVVHLHDIVRA